VSADDVVAGTRFPLKKFRFLIASGPTQEPIDPVRFISNYSTGTMGKYLTWAAKKRGHKVTWVCSPEEARTATDLLKKLRGLIKNYDALVMASAVCDVRPSRVSASKIRKDKLHAVSLKKNPDILAALAKRKKPGQVFIGFALESENVLKNAFRKLKQKKLEAILVQKVTRTQSPFGDKKIDAFLLDKARRVERFRSATKKKIAETLIRRAERFLID